MKTLCKGILSFFIGMALVSCAGTNSSVQTKVEENPSLFKAGTPVADSLVSCMPDFARSVFKETLESVSGECYYHVTDGRIDTLFQKDGGQYKTVASVAYDSLDGQNNYELRKGSTRYRIEKGTLFAEQDFPKYIKVCWNNGSPKQILKGHLYMDDQGFIEVDSGRSELYFENGKIEEQKDWKAGQIVASKTWNENGILTVELNFPKSTKTYWDNGKLKLMATGLLYRDYQGVIKVDSGHSEIYFENGKINQQADWKDKQPIAIKQWNENGTLIKELDFPKYLKEYWDDGSPKTIMTGFLYKDDLGSIKVDSGHSELYFENGKIKEQNDWKDKQPVASKQWNESGVLIRDIDLPKSAKEYWDNGKLKNIMTGLLYKDDLGTIEVDSGHSELYFENGKIEEQKDWKDRQIVAGKTWNENGILTVEFNFPKYLKDYWDNGKLKTIMTGLLYRDDLGSIKVDSGHSEVYFENGKINQRNDWKDRQIVANKTWNENGILTVEINFPKYLKDYWDNGKLKTIMTGLLYRDDLGSIEVDSGHSELYFENGKIKERTDWKDRRSVTGKHWNENGNLTAEINYPNYAKGYYDNGKPSVEMKGTLYYDEQNKIQVQDGFQKIYRENGKLALQKNYKGKKLVGKTVWNESGIITISVELPSRYREFYDNGKLKVEVTGTIVEEEDSFKIKDGTYKEYDPNGKVTYTATFKDFQRTSEK